MLEGACIGLGDETGLRSAHRSGATWSEMGQKTLVKASGRERYFLVKHIAHVKVAWFGKVELSFIYYFLMDAPLGEDGGRY